MNLRNTYYNIHKMERNFSKKKLINEEFSFRSVNGNKSLDLTERQKQILNKNKIFTKTFMKYANEFRSIICRRNRENNY